MHRHIKKPLLKILTLSTFIVLAFNIGVNLLNASILTKKDTKNQVLYKKINNKGLGKSGVAISTNIGIIGSSIGKYNDVLYTKKPGNIQNQNQELIKENMSLIKDYLNLLRTEPRKIIHSSYDKAAILDAYIDQLEFRYQNGLASVKNLTEQKEVFMNIINTENNKIETLKAKMSVDFRKGNSEASLEDINKYLQLRTQIDLAKVYIIYMNHFIKQYNFLNRYCLDLAGILMANKEAIIKDTYVVIPRNTGLESLKKFDLIYTK